MDQAFRTGFVALIGRPNVGKSTLLNRYAGQKIAAVSDKPQTTRHRIRGVVAGPDVQVIFVDTPGIHTPFDLLGDSMLRAVKASLEEVDVIAFMVDGSNAPGPGDRFVAALVKASGKPTVLVLNKVDRQKRGATYQAAYALLGTWHAELPISAQKGKNCGELRRLLATLLPIGPPLFPTDQITDQSMRDIAQEMIREQVLRQTSQEIPYSVAVRVDEWIERAQNLTYIGARVLVERESQQRILIGEGGNRLRHIGEAARSEIERMIGHQIYLDLRVKVLPHWRREREALKRLGFVVD